MPDLDPHYRFRDQLEDRLRRDLLGPVGEAEVLVEEPATAYIVGVLFPRSDKEAESSERQERGAEQEVDETTSIVKGDEAPDTGVAMANRNLPSAMGLTFAVDTTKTREIVVGVIAAVYQPTDVFGNLVSAQRHERRSAAESDVRWVRRALTEPGELIEVRVDVLDSGPHVDRIDSPLCELSVRTRVRAADADGVVSVTVTLVNEATVERGALMDQYCVFQPEVHVGVPGGSEALIQRASRVLVDEDEVLLSDLLHRHAPVFATGHGCSAEWDWNPPSARGPRTAHKPAVSAVRSSFVPAREVLLTDSNPDIGEPGMLELAELSSEHLRATLMELVGKYREWIDARTNDAALLPDDFDEVARTQLLACKQAAKRMEAGVELLADPDVLRAFRLACRAMADQRARTVWIRNGRVGAPDPAVARWRPFQIGFILLCLAGITDRHHPDRDIADVLWFPTGGGKTEAYLGLVALTTFLRRIRHGAAGAGVTVLMRYTLRLLTLQQFERAAALICAMDLLRREDVSLGDEPISIGMWVGEAATPNKLKDAAKSLRELAAGDRLHEKNPVQLTACPWCGTKMDHRQYLVDVGASSMRVVCPDPECPFASGLPVHVVDEDIYSVRPTLLIATSDKFAGVAWKDEPAALFNRRGAVAGTPAPELVIQDELHLISGPLGTLAGLYETAIDVVADRPKIIASTATIRRAQEQGRRLFDRQVHQFPPAGLDSRDSWFAVEAPRESKATRRYVGVMAPSTSQASLLIRTYAALLHHGCAIDGPDDVRDAYWTLVGYFNSLRLLSAAELQVHADVAERIKQLAERDGIPPRDVDTLELTSRIASSEVRDHLDALAVALPDKAARQVVLATNMISVGVDVDRLGLMAVTGQPQTTAEYIQSTSRVGRRHPGLVVTMLNAARSRDRSHYEDFGAFHSALYRQVESTSVTPFAARARDRALHAALVGIVRTLHPVARSNISASAVETFLDEVEEAKALILDRVGRIEETERAGVAADLDQFVDHWRELAQQNSRLVYQAPFRARGAPARADDVALLRSYGEDDDLGEAYDTMWSLRDVDVESPLYLER